MGCVCGKPSAIEDSRESPPSRVTTTSSSVPARPAPPYAVAERPSAPPKQQVSGGAVRAGGAELERRSLRDKERERGVSFLSQSHSLRVGGGIPKALEGEQVAAGWPPWLAAVAGEAVRGWIPRRADSFEKLDKIGQGTYSNVYRARDLDKEKIVALKKVRFDNLEPESVKFMAREIIILRRLDHPNIIKLEGLVTSRMSCSLYLVFEYMEHDLAGLASSPSIRFTEPQIKCYMQQLLRGLHHCHSRGILHRDIKGSNLLIDDSGMLKIADFGLASFFDPQKNNPLTSRVVTLWYRPPELLLGSTSYGVAVDLWSTGCILAELYNGKPIMPGRTEVEQLHKIFKLCGSPSEEYWRKSKLPHATIFKPQHPYRRCVTETFKDFPPPALALVDVLLSIDPTDRGTATSALKSEFFTTKPLACDPSSLPKYPPSKEFDAKRRDEESRRQGGTVIKAQLETRQRESRAVPAPEANAELVSSMLKRQNQPGSKSRSEKFNPYHDESASGFPIEPANSRPPPVLVEDSHQANNNRSFYSGPLVNLAPLPAANRGPLEYGVITKLPPRSNVNNDVMGGAHARRLSASISVQEDTKQYEQREEEKDGNVNFLVGYGSKGNKIHYSGPLIRPSGGNVDQMLKDHDRQIQEVVRRSRADKSKLRKTHGDSFVYKLGEHNTAPVYPSSRALSFNSKP